MGAKWLQGSEGKRMAGGWESLNPERVRPKQKKKLHMAPQAKPDVGPCMARERVSAGVLMGPIHGLHSHSDRVQLHLEYGRFGKSTAAASESLAWLQQPGLPP